MKLKKQNTCKFSVRTRNTEDDLLLPEKALLPIPPSYWNDTERDWEKSLGRPLLFSKQERKRNVSHWPLSYKVSQTRQPHAENLYFRLGLVLLCFLNQIRWSRKRWAHLHTSVGHFPALSHLTPPPPSQTATLTSCEDRRLFPSPLVTSGV